MKRRLRNNLVILLLINISFLSLVYYISSIKFEYEKDNCEEINTNKYWLGDPYFLDPSIELLSIDSADSSQFIEINRFFEDFLQDNEEIFYVLCLIGSGLYFEFQLFSKFISKSCISGDCTLFEIEGVNVTLEENKILDLIQEYLDYNRVFNKEKVALFIKSRNRVNGNLNYNGITTVIDSLIKKNIIVEGSKLTRKTVLLNINRKQIYHLIKENPGIYKNSLTKKLKVCPFVTKWHLSMLLTFRLIREVNINGHIGYFDTFLSTEKDIIFYTISKEKCSRIVEFLKLNSTGCTKSQISKALHMHYNTVTKYLDEIDKFNLLVKKNVNRKEFLHLNEDNLNQLKHNLT